MRKPAMILVLTLVLGLCELLIHLQIAPQVHASNIQIGFPVLERTSTNQSNRYANSAGTLTSGDCVSIDANHNFIDSGTPGCGGAGATLTNSLLIIPSDSSAGISTPRASGVIYCMDFPLIAPITLTTTYQGIQTAGVASSVYGVAIYDATQNRLTGATQTGTSAASTSTSLSVALGGGTVTLSPGSAGKAALCYSSNGGTGLHFYSPMSDLVSFIQPSGNRVTYLAGNSADFSASPTITWPATLGGKNTPGTGVNFPTTLLLP